jgi:hypothetical protein
MVPSTNATILTLIANAINLTHHTLACMHASAGDSNKLMT